ncbi:MAG TPA: NAD(P)H-dependent oxidoreductase, partial [Opitutaceae bacterium]|nr:NAD(P)H-dependent oxidoreductase [Opitutaceae bacterium]
SAHIPVATAADMEWANAYLFSAPTRFGVMASQMRAFIDTLGGTWAKGALANKAVSAMASAQNAHGGQEATILSFYATACHWGSIVVPPGYTDPVLFKVGGNPYGYSHTQGAEFTPDAKAAISHQARRLVSVAAKLN